MVQKKLVLFGGHLQFVFEHIYINSIIFTVNILIRSQHYFMCYQSNSTTCWRPFFCDTYTSPCSKLSRVAFLESNFVMMVGKVVTCVRRDEYNDKGGKLGT